MLSRIKQIGKENSYTKDAVKQEIDVYMSELKGLDALSEAYESYKESIILSDIKHSVFHYDLLDSIRKSNVAVISLVMKRIITSHVMLKGNYLDRNAVAMQIGKKVAPKTYSFMGDTYRIEDYHRLSIGLNLIQFMTSTKLIHTHTMKSAEKHNIVVLDINLQLAESLKDLRLLVYETRAGMPMLVKPNEHKEDQEGGYLTVGQTMLNGNTINHETTQKGLCLDAINKQQDIAFKVRNKLPMFEEYKAEDKWYDSMGKFMDMEYNKLIDDIELVHGKEFYAPLAFDFRGRINDKLAYLKIQGDKYSKAYYEFNKREVLTQQGLDYLKVAIVNEVYSDKISFKDAISFFDAQDEIIPTSPISMSLVRDYELAMEGKAVGSITHWDATNSGLQFYSLLGKDDIGAALCNVIGLDNIADAYKALADHLNKLLEVTTFNRSNVKKAFMTYLYGAQGKNILTMIVDPKNGVTNGIAEFYPKDMELDAMWEVFEEAMRLIAPAAVELMNLIYSYVDAREEVITWTMPDGFVVNYSPTQTVTIKGHFIDLVNECTHEGSIDTKIVQGNKFDRALAPNIIHAVDSYFLREVTRRCDFEVSTIHDSFGCHPNNVEAMMQVIREVSAGILDMNLLEYILEQINPRLTKRFIAKGRFVKGNLTREQVLASKYIVR